MTYEYDAFDRRIAKTVDNTPIGSINRYEYYVWSGDDVIFDFVDPDGTSAAPLALSKRYLWGESVDQLFAQEDVTTGVLWTLGDNLGTTRDLVDNTGAVVSSGQYKYDAFGKVTSGDTTKTRFLYTAQEYDPDTGLVYYNARWYDPQAARFLSHDSWGFAAGDTNLSRYVENSPTNWIDPSGHAPIDSGGLVPPTEQEGDGELPPGGAASPAGEHVLPPDWDFGESDATQSLYDSLTPAQKAQLARSLGGNGAQNRASKDWKEALRRFAVRFASALQAAGGVFQCVQGAVIIVDSLAMEELTLGASTVGVLYGGTIFIKGLDNGSTGLTIVQTGEQQSTRFAGAVEGLTGSKELGETLDIAIDLASGAGAPSSAAKIPSVFARVTATGQVVLIPAVIEVTTDGCTAIARVTLFFSKARGKSESPASSKDKSNTEQHHQLPREFEDKFNDAGLDIEDYVVPMDKKSHRLKPDGIHTNDGGNWNKQWKEFFTENPNADAPEILEQLGKMQQQFGLE